MTACGAVSECITSRRVAPRKPLLHRHLHVREVQQRAGADRCRQQVADVGQASILG
jgi:hypothetical protein